MTTRTVFVDQDGGVDDALALALLARTPDIELAGVGSVHGNVHATAAARNALRALELAGDHTTPVTIGAHRPLTQALHLAHPSDPFAKLARTPRRTPVLEETTAEQLVRLARQRPGELDVLTLAPLTNIALALHAEPDLPQLVRRVVSMAGVLWMRGNASEVAESNVWHDPDAASQVIAAKFDLTLVPLDVTRHATMTRLWLQHHAATRPRLRGRIAAKLLDVSTKLPASPIHDALAAAILLDPTIATYQHAALTVDLDNHTRGQTRTTTSGQAPSTAIVTEAKADTLLTQLLHTVRNACKYSRT